MASEHGNRQHRKGAFPSEGLRKEPPPAPAIHQATGTAGRHWKGIQGHRQRHRRKGIPKIFYIDPGNQHRRGPSLMASGHRNRHHRKGAFPSEGLRKEPPRPR